VANISQEQYMSLPFRDRHDAGRQLADKLHCYAGPRTMVLGLLRGGVPTGYEIAHGLQAPLDLLLLRNVCLPGEAGTVLGVVASGGTRVLHHDVVLAQGITPEAVAEATQAARISLLARERAFRGPQSLSDARDRLVIIADDGSTTTDVLLDAVAAVRSCGPQAIVLALPVVVEEDEALLRAHADDVVSVAKRRNGEPPEAWYHEWLPISHTEIRALLSLSVAEAQSRELATLARV
jgi:putative phosphoribosyl transferase